MSKINTLLISGTGLVSTEAVPAVLDAVTNDTPNIIQIIVQLVIGVATLINLFKRKKTI